MASSRSFGAGLSRSCAAWPRFFLTYTAIGSTIFCFGLTYLGEVAGKNIDGIITYVHDFALIIVGAILLLALGGIVWWRIAKARDSRKDIAA